MLKLLKGAKSAKPNMLTSMTFDLVMDRKIEEGHYISPGGYQINGKTFDFISTSGKYDNDRIVCKAWELDDTYSDRISEEDVRNGRFNEFFIHTGEYNDPEIKAKEVDNLYFFFADGTSVKASEALKRSANEALAS